LRAPASCWTRKSFLIKHTTQKVSLFIQFRTWLNCQKFGWKVWGLTISEKPPSSTFSQRDNLNINSYLTFDRVRYWNGKWGDECLSRGLLAGKKEFFWWKSPLLSLMIQYFFLKFYVIFNQKKLIRRKLFCHFYQLQHVALLSSFNQYRLTTFM